VIYTENDGNCTYSGKKVGDSAPLITSLNGTGVNADPDAAVTLLAFRVCSNPKPWRVRWLTPVYALRPGQGWHLHIAM
jgi:hypothetical protein